MASDFSNYAGYGISKAALNLANAKFASRFRDEGIIFVAINPGLVRTLQGRKYPFRVFLYAVIRLLISTMDAAKEEVEMFYRTRNEINRAKNPDFEGAITVEQSVGDILTFIDKATVADSGTFVHRDGRDADTP